MSTTDYERISLELDNTRQKDHPRAYEQLSPAEKDALQYWIEHAIQPATKVDEHQSSYGLKYEYARETKCYVSNAQFKGAMLVAGYLPTKQGEQNWHFTIAPTDTEAGAAQQGTSHDKRGRVHTYRCAPPGQQDARLNDLVKKALASSKGNTTYTVMF